MVSDLDVPQIALVGERPTLGASPPTSPTNSFSPVGRTSSPFDVHDFLSLPTPILRNSRNSLDVPTSPTLQVSDPSLHPPPSCTLSARSSNSNRWDTSTVLRSDNPEENDGPSSLGLLTPPSQGHRRKTSATTVSSIGSISTGHDNRSPSLRRSSHSDEPSIRPSPTNSAETNPGSEITQEAGLNVEPFAFKPLQLANLVDPKSLENLERLGGVDGLLRGLGTNRHRGLSTKLTQLALRSPEIVNAVHPDGETSDTIITSLTAVPEGLQRTASLGGSSGGGDPASPKILAHTDEVTVHDRQRIYRQNILPQRPTKNLLLLMWLALRDKVIVLLFTAATVSLALGLFQDFRTSRPQREPPVDWVHGVAIIAAILIIIIVGSLNDWQKERQLQVLDEKNEVRRVKVIRDGGERKIDVHQVVIGDVVLLEPGEVAPCDGVFLSGYNMWCNESSATGELDAIKKLSYEECIALRDKRRMEFDPDGPSGDDESINASQRTTDPSSLELFGHADCFIVGGSKVVEGVGSYVAVSVGTKSFNGRIKMALQRNSNLENTPLQLKLNGLSEIIAKIGRIAAGLLFTALLVRYFVQLGTNNPQRTSSEKGMAFINTLIIALTLMVAAVPKGLPSAVTHTLAFATKRMSRDNILVRVLGSCETMAYASVICTDKTALTQNEMTVVAVSVGVHTQFVRRPEVNEVWTGGEARRNPDVKDISINLANLNTTLSDPLKHLFNAAIAINSTVFEDVDPESGLPVFIGSKTETALLGFAKELGWPNSKDTRDSANVIQMIPFSSDRKFTGCVVRLADGSHRLYVKGASEVLARKCTRHVVEYRYTANEAPSGNEVKTVPIMETEEDNISHTIASYASQALRTITLCYRDFPNWPPQGARLLGKDEVDYDDLTTDLTLICITAIEDPLRAGVREAVDSCGKAVVRVKMCTGDNVLTARSIARQCGIYTPGGIVMEGSYFRTLSPDIMKAIVPQLQVLARSSPEDKRILVKTLKELGEVVGVTGAGTDDGPILKTAHVGSSMGIAGVEVAKEASDIILMDDNFSSIVKAVMWGRSVNDSVRKFLQFLISAHFTTIVIMIVWALASSSEKPILGAVQLLWIDIIMGTFAALALVTDPASPVLLDRNPGKTTDPLFTINMTKQILGQATYQIITALFLHFLGSRILGFHHTDDPTLQKRHDDIVQTLVFNVFVFAQVFNSFNCRRLDRKLSVFEGMSKNRYFMAITTIEVAVQVLICFIGGAAFGVTRIGAREWCISVSLGFVSLPLGALIRLIPNEPCERVFKKLKLLPEPELLPTTRPDAEPGFSFAVDQVRDNLGTFARLHGCHVRGSSYLCESRIAFPDPDGPHPVPGPLAMVPSLDVVTPGWQPRTFSDPVGIGRSALCENGFEVHPDTPWDDPVYGLLGVTQRPFTSQ
ncbi:calcium-translocating P-type ATPase [Lactarius vividus]|nr:calcium-translocating P-type ATPase [Lactarius vividus]